MDESHSTKLDAMIDIGIRDARTEDSFGGANIYYGPHGSRYEIISPSDADAVAIRATVRHLVLDRMIPMPTEVRLIMIVHLIRLKYGSTNSLEQTDREGNWMLWLNGGHEVVRTRLETAAELSQVIEKLAKAKSE